MAEKDKKSIAQKQAHKNRPQPNRPGDMNPIDSSLADAYERHGGPLQAWGHLARKTGRGAKKAVKKGGRALVDYFTNKLSRRKSK